MLSTRPAPPSTGIYDQNIPSSGYGYLRTRDGTKLSIYVHPPSDVTSVLPGLDLPALPSGAPTPTLIEYAGYGYADPDGPQSGISILANLMGFTVVDVNMRGTGCSGGSFDFFEPLQSLDGYDVIETIARQPWVANGKVGMMGISYGGISQLFTAATNPPSLAAISPLSVIDSTQTTLYPGGILNTGFALEWAKERVHDALPASPDGGQAWAYKRIQEGDQTCKANQDLHPEAVNLLQKVEDNDHYKPKVADPLAPITFVHKIKAPVFMACQWTDEQTGGHCPTLASKFTGTDRKWFTFTNGTHVDSLDPETFNRWYDFLKLYVAEQAPISNSALIQAAAPVIYQEAMGIPGVTLPPDPIQLRPTYQGALNAYEDLKPVRILFDNGAGGLSPGQPRPGFEQSFSSFPVPGTTGRSWYFARGGKLTDSRPGRREASRFGWDPDATSPTNFTGDTAEGGLWHGDPRLPLAAASRRHRRLLPDETARRGRGGARRRLRQGVGPLVEAERRSPGDHLRGPARRQGDLRPGWLGAGERAPARPPQEHAAGTGPQPPRTGRLAAAAGPVRAGHDPALLPGPCLPLGIADPGDHLGSERRPADLGVREDEAEGIGQGRDRLLAAEAVAADPADRRRRGRPDRPPTVPGPARRALPRLRTDREPAGQALEPGAVPASGPVPTR